MNLNDHNIRATKVFSCFKMHIQLNRRVRFDQFLFEIVFSVFYQLTSNV